MLIRSARWAMLLRSPLSGLMRCPVVLTATERGVWKSPTLIVVFTFLLAILPVLLYVFLGCVVGSIYICTCYIFLDCPLRPQPQPHLNVPSPGRSSQTSGGAASPACCEVLQWRVFSSPGHSRHHNCLTSHLRYTAHVPRLVPAVKAVLVSENENTYCVPGILLGPPYTRPGLAAIR